MSCLPVKRCRLNKYKLEVYEDPCNIYIYIYIYICDLSGNKTFFSSAASQNTHSICSYLNHFFAIEQLLGLALIFMLILHFILTKRKSALCGNHALLLCMSNISLFQTAA